MNCAKRWRKKALPDEIRAAGWRKRWPAWRPCPPWPRRWVSSALTWDWIIDLPWIESRKTTWMWRMYKVLANDHYGQREGQRAILEFIQSRRSLRQDEDANLCLWATRHGKPRWGALLAMPWGANSAG